MGKKFKKMRIIARGVALILVGVLFLGFVLFQVSKSRTFQFFGGLTYRVNTQQKIVAFTFDDAPSEKTQEVLDILKQKNIKATFYEIGKEIEGHPQEAKAIVDAGMEVGNHSYSHQRFLLKSLSFIDSEIQETNRLIRNSGYQGNITFRPPNGKKLFGLPWYLHLHNIQTIMWDVEPDTYVSDDFKSIADYTISHTQPGSIILIHPFCSTTCEADRKALPVIIDELKNRGYEFVTVSNLLKYQ